MVVELKVLFDPRLSHPAHRHCRREGIPQARRGGVRRRGGAVVGARPSQPGAAGPVDIQPIAGLKALKWRLVDARSAELEAADS